MGYRYDLNTLSAITERTHNFNSLHRSWLIYENFDAEIAKNRYRLIVYYR